MTTVNYPVGDFLIQIKNSSMSGSGEVSVRRTNLIVGVAEALKRARFVDKIEDKGGKVTVTLRRHNKKPLLLNIKLVSKPGLRIYMGVDELKSIKGPSLFVISTPKGVLLSKEAIKEVSGGEVLAEVL